MGKRDRVNQFVRKIIIDKENEQPVGPERADQCAIRRRQEQGTQGTQKEKLVE
jgi:cation transport regulator ChaC